MSLSKMNKFLRNLDDTSLSFLPESENSMVDIYHKTILQTVLMVFLEIPFDCYFMIRIF